MRKSVSFSYESVSHRTYILIPTDILEPVENQWGYSQMKPRITSNSKFLIAANSDISIANIVFRTSKKTSTKILVLARNKHSKTTFAAVWLPDFSVFPCRNCLFTPKTIGFTAQFLSFYTAKTVELQCKTIGIAV